jgi:cobalt-zinc-cadmium efflux system outer membrane protein
MRPFIFRLLCLVPFCLQLIMYNAFAGELKLQELIEESLKNGPEVLAAESKWKTSTFKIPQAKSLPDPMFMFGYQNEGFRKITYGKSSDAEFMFSASQMFPFPGKLPLKGEMAQKDAESLGESYKAVRLKTIAQVKELYYDLFLTNRDIELIKDKSALFSRIEEAALARYSSGTATQQEVLMAQLEKYMLIEKEEMLDRKIQTIEAMLNATMGRNVESPLGKPAEPAATVFRHSIGELLKLAYTNSPEIKSRDKMVDSAKTKVSMAEKEYYPDIALTGSFFKRPGEFEDMWSLTTTINIPLYYRKKQRQAVFEAKSSLSESVHELEATKLMLSSNIRDNYAMAGSSEKLLKLYREVLIPKTYQDFELALSGYAAGRIEAITVINRLKALLDFELSYWEQFVAREKAIARLDAITGITDSGPEVRTR